MLLQGAVQKPKRKLQKHEDPGNEETTVKAAGTSDETVGKNNNKVGSCSQ
jgi:hypothetical protein